MLCLGPAAFFDHIPQFVEDLIAVDQCTTLSLASAVFQFRLELTKGFVTFLLMAFKES